VKTPSDPGLVDFLASRAARTMVFADVITFYLVGGDDENYRLRWTTAQQDVSEYPLDGDPIRRTWRARPVAISGLRARQSIGVNVDEQDMTISPRPDTTIQGIPFRKAVLQGALDGARVRRDRYYYADWGQPTQGGAPKFMGFVSTFTSLGRMDAVFKVKSGLVLLEQQMPRQLAGPTCVNHVYNGACGLDAAAHAVHTSVAAGATPVNVPLAAPSPDFALGRINFEDEGIVGVWRSVKDSDGVGVKLYVPLEGAPVNGESVTCLPGCDRTKAGGCTRLGNTGRFRGFEHVPQADKAV
jgi:hypothetical protein